MDIANSKVNRKSNEAGIQNIRINSITDAFSMAKVVFMFGHKTAQSMELDAQSMEFDAVIGDV